MERKQAIDLLKKYNKEEFHLRHAITVEGVMRYFAKELGYDAVHDTVHEMCKDEARHGKGFEGLLKRYFN